MARKKNDGVGALAVIAVVAFLVGRCSADEREDEATSPPSSLYTAPDTSSFEGVESSPEPPRARFVSPEPSRSSGTSFRNCSEARAAGAAPVMEGDPGYAPRLDRDGDGVGCE